MIEFLAWWVGASIVAGLVIGRVCQDNEVEREACLSSCTSSSPPSAEREVALLASASRITSTGN